MKLGILPHSFLLPEVARCDGEAGKEDVKGKVDVTSLLVVVEGRAQRNKGTV